MPKDLLELIILFLNANNLKIRSAGKMDSACDLLFENIYVMGLVYNTKCAKCAWSSAKELKHKECSFLM